MSVPCHNWACCEECGGVGADDNANFSCSVCRSRGSVPTRQYHYEVLSPEVEMYGGSWDPPEPPECGRYWALLLAANAREAICAAVKLPEFKRWVSDARADGVPPWKGLRAQLARCEHGSCWGCWDEDEEPGCPECKASAEAASCAAPGEGAVNA